MKTIILSLLAFGYFQISAQTDLTYDKLLIDAVDHWVAFRANDDGTHNYGFVYIDPEAGLTFHSEGTFKPASSIYQVKKTENANIKVRLEPINVKVAVIPQELFSQLEIEATPSWLASYKSDLNTAKTQYDLGYLYNAWNQCAKALEHLKKSEALKPDTKGVAVEMAFSYNCLENYDKAAEILEESIVNYPSDAYMNKELIYSLTKNKSGEKAAKQYYAFTKDKHDDTHDAENAFNIMQYYYNQRDKKNFAVWYKEMKKCSKIEKQLIQYADLMKNDL